MGCNNGSTSGDTNNTVKGSSNEKAEITPEV